MARPPEGLEHVERLAGPREVKHRLRVILETLQGDRTVAEVCEELGIGEARFHVLRRQALEGAMTGLLPRPTGRPRTKLEPLPEVEELKRENEDLQMELWAAEIREEIALTMPHLLGDRSLREKKIARRKRIRARKKNRGGTSPPP